MYILNHDIQHIYMNNRSIFRLLVLTFFIAIAFTRFARKDRIQFNHSYVNYLIEGFCPKQAEADESQLAVFREERKGNQFIKVSLDDMLNHKVTMTYDALLPKFFETVTNYAYYFIALCISLCIVSCCNSRVAIKTGINVNESVSFGGSNRTCLIFKWVIIALFLFNTYQSISGLRLSNEVEGGLNRFFCGLVNFPKNFARKDVSTKLDAYSTYNDYHHEALCFRQLFNEVKQNCTKLQKANNAKNFQALTQKFSGFLGGSEHSGFMNSISRSFWLVQTLKGQSKQLGLQINILREFLYWIKGAIAVKHRQLMQNYRIQNVPSIAGSIVWQVYLLLFACSAGMLFVIVKNIKNPSSERNTIKWAIVTLTFSAFVCLVFSLLGTIVLSVPNAGCNTLAAIPNKGQFTLQLANRFGYGHKMNWAAVNQAFQANPSSNRNLFRQQIYPSIDEIQRLFKTLSDYNYESVQTKLISQQPALEKEIRAYFEYYPSFLQKISDIHASSIQIVASIANEGNYGRLSLRAFGESVENLEKNFCDTSLYILSRSTKSLFSYAVACIAIMICLAFYIICIKCIKSKSVEIPVRQDDMMELSERTEQKIIYEI